jgi:hypothetical protein
MSITGLIGIVGGYFGSKNSDSDNKDNNKKIN